MELLYPKWGYQFLGVVPIALGTFFIWLDGFNQWRASPLLWHSNYYFQSLYHCWYIPSSSSSPWNWVCTRPTNPAPFMFQPIKSVLIKLPGTKIHQNKPHDLFSDLKHILFHYFHPKTLQMMHKHSLLNFTLIAKTDVLLIGIKSICAPPT